MADTAAAAEKTKKPRQGRSPAYPGIDLKTAIDKAQALHATEGNYAVPMPSAFAAWGYSAKSSGGRETRAALRYFGLITVEGDSETGKVKLTEKALRVLLDKREDQTEKKALIRELALTPSVHKQLLADYPHGIKSDASVAHSLMFDHNYNQSAASEIVAEFKATAAYAGLYDPDIVVDNLVTDLVPDEAADATVKTLPPQSPKPTGGIVTPAAEVKLMDGERIVFTEESNPQNYLKLIASGDVDGTMLEALEDYVKRQKRRLGIAPGAPAPGARMPFMITAEAKARLRELGHDDEAIRAMTPEAAHKLLGWLPPLPY
jgi:hypothetical protein